MTDLQALFVRGAKLWVQGAVGGRPAMVTQGARLAAAQATKLANALFAHELQRRLGGRGVASCAVDPGSVATNIYAGSALFSRQPLRWLIQNFYAPPSDGAAAVIHAACTPWERPAQQHRGAGSLAGAYTLSCGGTVAAGAFGLRRCAWEGSEGRGLRAGSKAARHRGYRQLQDGRSEGNTWVGCSCWCAVLLFAPADSRA